MMSYLLDFFFGNIYSLSVNVTIFALTLFATHRLYTIYKRLQDEDANINSIDDYITKNENPKVSPAKLLPLCTKNSAVFQRIMELCKVYEKKKYISLETFEHINDKINFPESESVKRISGIMVLLGLFGTVLGLSGNIIHIKSTIDKFGQAQIEELINTILQFLSGMETAFSTTISGMLSTLLLIFLVFLFERAKTRYESKYSLLILSKVLPDTNDDDSGESIGEMTVSIRENSALLKTLVETTSRVSNDARSQYDLLVNTIAAMVKTISSIKQPFDEGNKISEQILEISSGFKDGISELKVTTSEINTSVNSFVETSTKTNGLLEETIQQMKLGHIDNRDLVTRLDSYSQTTNQLITNLGSWSSETKQFVDELTTINLKYATSVTAILNRIDGASTRILDSLSNRANEITTEIKTSVQNILRDFSGNMIAVIQQFNELLAERLSKIDERLKDSYTEQISKHILAIESLKSAMAELIIKIDNYVKLSKDNIETISKEQGELLINDVKKTNEEALSKIQKFIDQSFDTLNLTDSGRKNLEDKIQKVIDGSANLEVKIDDVLKLIKIESPGPVTQEKNHEVATPKIPEPLGPKTEPVPISSRPEGFPSDRIPVPEGSQKESPSHNEPKKPGEPEIEDIPEVKNGKEDDRNGKKPSFWDRIRKRVRWK